MTLPTIPQKEGVDRNWSPETWRAGLDEAVRLAGYPMMKRWDDFAESFSDVFAASTIAHATTLLDAGIVKPVLSEAAKVVGEAFDEWDEDWQWHECPKVIAVIQSALDKARNGQ